MFNSRPTDVHCIGQIIKSLEHGIDDSFMFPAANTPFFASGTFGFQRTLAALGRPVGMQRSSGFDIRIAIGERLTGWTAIGIAFFVIDEVGLPEAACCL